MKLSIAKIKKFILNKVGLCEVCWHPIVKNIRGEVYCPNCKTNQAINKWREKQQGGKNK